MDKFCMNKLNQKLENGQYCDALFSDISNSLKDKGIVGISQSDLKNKKNFETESDKEMNFKIEKGNIILNLKHIWMKT